MKIVPANWEDRFSWIMHKRDTSDSLYIVRQKVIVGGKTLMLTVENDGLSYSLANPLYMTCSSKEELDIPTAVDWMDTVNIGDSLYLGLYPIFQTSISDSIRVMDNEVYGYWFATPIE